MRTPTTLNVFANPWHAGLDKNERPCSRMSVPHDGASPFYDLRYVAASRELDQDGELYWAFEQYDSKGDLLPNAEPARVLNDQAMGPRFRQAIKAGEIFAADVESYKQVFGTTDGFEPPAALAAKAKADALKAHDAHGRGPADPKPVTNRPADAAPAAPASSKFKSFTPSAT